MTWSSFTESVQSADFQTSTRILFDSYSANTLEEISEKIQAQIEYEADNTLKLRDHVFRFLDLEPFYFALLTPSYELLRNLAAHPDSRDPWLYISQYVTDLVENRNPVVKEHLIEIDVLGSTRYAPLIPDILSERVRELQTVRVDFSRARVANSTRVRYDIAPLWSTAYGRRLLTVAGRDPSSRIVGDSVWKELADSLQALGYNTTDMLNELDEYQWSAASRRESGFSQATPRIELLSLKACTDANLMLDSPEIRYRIQALERIRAFETVACNRKLRDILGHGEIREQVVALDIAAKWGGAEEEAVLSSLLAKCDSKIRPKIAQALSLLISRDFSKTAIPELVSTLPGKKDVKSTKKSIQVLEKISQSRDRNARIDAAKALAFIRTPEAEQLLFEMMKDSDAHVRYEIVSLLPNLGWELAINIIQLALDDTNAGVKHAAIRLGKETWPEQDWPDDI
ncbi:MAG: HEAT repeat domain-containing protein [Candidatus Thorarchaeota archaeon]